VSLLTVVAQSRKVTLLMHIQSSRTSSVEEPSHHLSRYPNDRVTREEGEGMGWIVDCVRKVRKKKKRKRMVVEQIFAFS
jgi:hypothetical protein